MFIMEKLLKIITLNAISTRVIKIIYNLRLLYPVLQSKYVFQYKQNAYISYLYCYCENHELAIFSLYKKL